MINLKDNTPYIIAGDNVNTYLPLCSIANKPISDLLDEKGNGLLVFPYSFRECKDEVGKQQIFSIQTQWKDCQCTKVTIETGNLAGFIGIGNTNVAICSRFSESTVCGKDYFLHYMLQKVLWLNIFKFIHSTDNESVFDFLLYLFPKMLNDALSQGLYKEYQRNEYNDANVRGVIDINRHLRRNIPFNGCVAYRTREFSHDNHIAELIRHTIEYINTQKKGTSILQNDADTRANVAKIILATPNYKKQNRQQVMKNNVRTIQHPYFTLYTPLQKLCMKILRHERLKYGNDKEEVYGILFDISWLWEEYLATLFVKYGFKHPDNRKGTGRIYLDMYNRFCRYPDFYDKEAGGITMDAKYKPKKNIDRNEENQMLTYMYRLKSKWGVFVNPTKGKNDMDIYPLKGYGKAEGAKLMVYSFPIPQEMSSYEEFEELILKSENEILDWLSIQAL